VPYVWLQVDDFIILLVLVFLAGWLAGAAFDRFYGP